MKKVKKYLIDKRALTLIEILLSIIILGVVVTIATTMIIQTFGIVGSSSSRMSTKQLTALAEDRIEKHLRTAAKNPDNNFGKESPWVFSGYSNEGDPVKYKLELKNNQLHLKVGIQAEEVILNNVNKFYIIDENNGVFKLYFDVNDDSNSISSEKIVTARNY